MRRGWLSVVLLTGLATMAQAGTTGKIAGRVVDAETGEPLPGVNIVIEGTTLGAATDINGEYVILNVPPGTYSVLASMIGYQKMRQVQVRVRVDLTTRLDFRLQQTVVDLGRTVEVVAERPLVQPDITSSRAILSSEQIQAMPVENFQQVLSLQAGVVQGAGGELHIRGGRAGEVVYMIDGISVTDPYSSGMAISIENSAIQEIELVSGTFNAEYGQAMSGVVNIITKEGSDRFTGSLRGYVGDWVSTHDHIFYNIGQVSPTAVKDLQANLSGPVPWVGRRATFFFDGRFLDSEGWLWGLRRYSPQDSNDFSNPDSTLWHIEETGDRKPVPMNPYRKWSGLLKLSYSITPGVKLTLTGMMDDSWSKPYWHKYKLDPDGVPNYYKRGYTGILTWTHQLSPRTFYTAKYSYFYTGTKSYVYENPYDSRYVSPDRFKACSGYRFYAGGVYMGHTRRSTTTHGLRFDITSQVTKIHQVKAGIEYHRNRLWYESFSILVDERSNWKPVVPYPWVPGFESSPNYDAYVHHPQDVAAYVQDKIELKDMIVNLGIRYERFWPDGRFPADPRDPDVYNPIRPSHQYKNWDVSLPPEQLIPYTLEERKSFWYRSSRPKDQISPRIGVAYPISDQGVIHFSYGHFLEIPEYAYLYTNPDFEVGMGLSTTMGNPDLEPQRTVSYEFGLQQQLTEDIGIDVTAYYKDIRNWLGTEIHETYIAGNRYALYINRDYANVRGIVFSLEKRHRGWVSANVDYTYGVAEGSASDPAAAFYDEANGLEPEKQFVPLDWDQTHTLNAVITVGRLPKWSISVVASYGSGLPYTPEYRGYRVAFENSERKPVRFNLDLRLQRTFRIGGIRLALFANVYNLLDRLNEDFVYTDTGRAGYTLIPRYTGRVYGPNTLEEYLLRPDFYSEPRQIKVGLEVGF